MSTVEDTNKETTEATQEEPQVDFVVDGASAKRKRDEESAEENATETAAEEEQQKKAKVEDSPKKSEDQPTVSTTEPTTETKTATSPVVAPVVAPVATETLPATTTTANGQELLILEIAPDKVGQVIGSKGLVIQEIQTRTGARAFVNQDFPPGVNRQANITGTAAQVKAAAELINMIISQGPTSIHVNSMGGGPTITQVIECSQPQVGKIIGSNGGTIKELQSKSGARIQIDQDFPPEVPRKINLTGTAAAVNLGIQLIQSIMAGNSPFPSVGGMGMGGGMGVYGPGAGGMGAPAVGQMQMNGSQASQIMDVPKSVVGKIIGRGGENINIIQRKSGARTQIDQSVPEGTPCKVHMTGSPQSIQMCMQMIQQIMMGVPMEQVGTNMAPGGGMPMQTPYGGGMGAYGGMGMGGMGGMGMGGMGGMPQQMGMQQPQYGGYGMPQQQMGQMGGMPGMGNMGMSNPSAGGYQAYGAAAGAGGMYPGMQQQQHQGYGVQQGMGGMQAAPAVAKPAASAWSEHKTDEGVTYWYNASTGVSQWERPKN